MTEITRVPLQPIARGALPKLWVGIATLALVGGGIAYAAMPPSVDVETIKAGKGASPTGEDVALINYKGTLANGKVFDQGQQAVLPVGDVVPGFRKALEQMQRGGRYHVVIPSELAYGDKQAGPIPPNSDLTFDIDLIDFKSRAEIEQQQRLIEQLRQMQGGSAGAMPPGAIPPGAMPPGAEAPPPPPAP